MVRGMLRDRVVDDARNKALQIQLAYLPDAIKDAYDVSIEGGALVLRKKSATQERRRPNHTSVE